MPPHVWAVVDDPSTASQDDCDNDDDGVCALCCHKRTTTVCGQCNKKYCAQCIDPHTCGDVGIKLYMLNHNSATLLYIRDFPMLQYALYYFLGTQFQAAVTVVEEQCMKAFLFARSCAL